MTRWRFIDAGSPDAPAMFGRMPVVAASVAGGGPPVLMTGVFGRGHFQIGWFEDVDAVIDLAEARAAGVQVFRRPVWGGGAAFYDTNASAFLAYFLHAGAHASLDDALDAFRPAMRAALDSLGLGDAEFEGSSDIRFGGRKLGTLISQDVLGTKVVGGFFNLRKPDLELYARIARVPEEKFKDKVIKDAVAYICTPRDVRGTDLPYEEFRDAVVAATRETLGIEMEPGPITAEEDASVAGFVDAVSADAWVRRVATSRFVDETSAVARVGFANVKGKKLVRSGVALDAAGTIVRALIAGDMHIAPPDALDRMADALVGARADDRDDVVSRLQAVFDAPDVTQPDAAAGITASDVAEAVALAAKSAG